MAEELRANIGSKSAISLQWGLVNPKFLVELVVPTNHSSQKRLNDLSHGIKIWRDLSSILSQSTRLTDRQTDGQTDRPTAFSSLDCPAFNAERKKCVKTANKTSVSEYGNAIFK